MFTVFIRAVILYSMLVLVIRAMGKRQIGQLQPFELAVTILIADLAATPMNDLGTPILYGVLPIFALVLCHSVITLLSLKSEKFRAMICGKPSVLIRDGKIDYEELRKMCYSLNDLMEALREKGQASPADVSAAVLEPSGKLSVFPSEEVRPIRPYEMDVHPPKEGLPRVLITDGRIHDRVLKNSGLNIEWLDKQLKVAGFSRNEVLIAMLDSKGMFYAQGKESMERCVQFDTGVKGG